MCDVRDLLAGRTLLAMCISFIAAYTPACRCRPHPRPCQVYSVCPCQVYLAFLAAEVMHKHQSHHHESTDRQSSKAQTWCQPTRAGRNESELTQTHIHTSTCITMSGSFIWDISIPGIFSSGIFMLSEGMASSGIFGIPDSPPMLGMPERSEMEERQGKRQRAGSGKRRKRPTVT
jgi:hypothetical protein